MRYLLLALALCAVPARAQVVPAALSTTTVCSPVTVSSSVPTSVYAPTAGPTSPYIQVYLNVYNTDGSNQVFCSQDPAVAKTGAHLGYPVNSSASHDWTIMAYQPWNCISGSSSASSVVVVCPTH